MQIEQLKCVVSGSFKYKPEIDLAIEELRDHGIIVLAPETGWVYIPPQRIYTLKDFRPLPNEREMSLKQIEDSFLSFLSQSNFLYVVNPDGYVGASTCLEMGFAIQRNIPIYSKNKTNEFLDDDPTWKERIGIFISLKDISEIVKDLTPDS